MPRRAPLSRLLPAAGSAVALAVTLVGCGGAGSVAVAPPSPTAAAATPCARLRSALPAKVAEHTRRDTRPASTYTAAWGDPAITMRCAAPPPNRPLSGDELSIDRVSWLVNRQGDVVTWVSLGRVVTVELDVPASYDDQDAIAADVSAAVARAVPRSS